MKVSRITPDNDFTFGNGLSNYLSASDAIRQKVKARLKSFRYDWFLDVDHGIDWLDLLSRPNATNDIQNEVLRIVEETTGVARVDSIDVTEDRILRKVQITVGYTDVYSETLTETIEVV